VRDARASVSGSTAANGDFYLTQILSATSNGSRIELRYAWDPGGDPEMAQRQELTDFGRELLHRLAAAVDRGLRESV
jgi:hypothetical protein